MSAPLWTPSRRPPFAWRRLLTLGATEAARHALHAGVDGVAAWDSMHSEVERARAGLAAGTVTVADVVQRAIDLASARDKGARALASIATDPVALGAMSAQLHADFVASKVFEPSVWACDAALCLVNDDAEGARFAALASLEGYSSLSEENFVPCPRALAEGWTPPRDLAEVVSRDGWVGFRMKPGVDPSALTPAVVAQIIEDSGVRSIANDWSFTGEAIASVGDVDYYVIPPINTQAQWAERLGEWVLIEATEETGVRWCTLHTALEPRNEREAKCFRAAVEDAITDAAEASSPAIRKAWRLWYRAHGEGAAFAVPQEAGGWRTLVPSVRLEAFIERWSL